MNTNHLSEELLQQLAIEGIENYPSEREHVKNCDACHLQVQLYRDLLLIIEESPSPEFQFNLQETVFQKIHALSPIAQPEKRKYSNSVLLLIAIITATGFLLYLLRKKILNLSKISDEFSLYLIISSGLLFIGIIVWEMFREYENKMNTLNHQ